MKKQSFLQGSIILVLSVIITKIISACFKIPITNMLGGTGMGYFSCAYGLFMPIYAISVTGLPTAVAKMVAENAAFNRYNNVRKIKRISLLTFLSFGVIATLIIIILALPFCIYVVENENALLSLYMIAPSIFFGCIMAVYRGYYEGLRNMFPTAISQIIEALVKLIAGIGLAYLVINYADKQFFETGVVFGKVVYNIKEAQSVALPYAAAAGIFGITLSSAGGALYLWLRNLIRGDGITKENLSNNTYIESGKSIFKSLVIMVIPIAIGSLITNLTSLIDLATIIRSLNKSINDNPEFYIHKFSEVISDELTLSNLSNFIYGCYNGLALTIFNLVPSFTNMFGKGVLPSLTEAWAVKDKPRIKRSVESVIFVTGLVSIPAGLGITVLARQILTLLYSSRMNEVITSYETLAVLGIGVIFLCLTTPIFSMLQAIGRADIPVKIMIFGVFIKLIGNIMLIRIPSLNVIGAGISTVICYAIICVISIVVLLRLTNVKFEFMKIIFKPLLCGFLCAISAFLSYKFLINSVSDSLSTLISIAFAGIIYLISIIIIGGLNKKEIKSLFLK